MLEANQLSVFAKLHVRFRQRHAFDAPHFRIGGQQKRQLRLQRNLKRIFAKWTLPAVDDRPARPPSPHRGAWPSPKLWQSPRLAPRTLPLLRASAGRWTQIPTRRCASTRMPSPIDSDCASVPTCPFFVVRSRWRMMHHAHIGVSGAAQRAVSSDRMQSPTYELIVRFRSYRIAPKTNQGRKPFSCAS